MKLVYQQMLAIVGVIVVTLTIVGALFIRNATNQAWDNSFDQLKEYTGVLKDRAVDSRTYLINTQFIKHAEEILADQNVRFMIYDAANRVRYPVATPGSNTQAIAQDYWTKLKEGRGVALRELSTNPQTGKQENITVYYKPVFLNQKLLFVLAAFSPVENIESSIRKTQKNILVAFMLSMVAAVLVSYLVARFQTARINKLRRATHQVAEGDYDVVLDMPAKRPKSRDEVAALASDFQDMVKSLKRSEAEIKRQEERRRQFMADAAHEMRTPLTTINGLLEGLAYDAIPEESKGESIALMQNETNRLIRLVNENLDYEKLRANQILLNKQTFNATAALHDIVAQLGQKAESAGDHFELDAPDEVPVFADHDRFVQVVFNITQNAIQFTQNGTITLRASATAAETQIIIEDTGIGMTPDQVQNIWERYYKADPSRKNTRYGESGLGLAIVHQLVTRHGGSITVASTPNVGTRFTILFPSEAMAPSQAPSPKA